MTELETKIKASLEGALWGKVSRDVLEECVEDAMRIITPLLGAGDDWQRKWNCLRDALADWCDRTEFSMARQSYRRVQKQMSELEGNAPDASAPDSPPSEPQPEEVDVGELIKNLDSAIQWARNHGWHDLKLGFEPADKILATIRRLPSASSDELERLKGENEFLQGQVESQRAMIAGNFKNQTVNLRARIAALEAERERLNDCAKTWIGHATENHNRAVCLEAERDAALAKLAAAEQRWGERVSGAMDALDRLRRKVVNDTSPNKNADTADGYSAAMIQAVGILGDLLHPPEPEPEKPEQHPAECVSCGVKGPLVPEDHPGWLCSQCYNKLEIDWPRATVADLVDPGSVGEGGK